MKISKFCQIIGILWHAIAQEMAQDLRVENTLDLNGWQCVCFNFNFHIINYMEAIVGGVHGQNK